MNNTITPTNTNQSPFTELGLTRSNESSTNQELGQDDFLTLMITQFQNQDPFSPMENGDFLGQMAQFSTVSGIEDLNSSISTLMGSLQSDQSLQASNLIDRTVQIPRQTISHTEGQPVNGAVQLTDPAQGLTVFIENINGELIERINLGPQSAGIAEFSWDGLSTNGETARSGEYRIRAEQTLPSGNVSTPVLIDARVDSVSLSGSGQGGLLVNLDDGSTTNFNSIQRIK